MARKKASDSGSVAQGKIPFAPSKSRRAAASSAAMAHRAVLMEKTAGILEQPRLEQRKTKQLQENNDDAKSSTQLSVEEVLNCEESQNLLNELYKDRIKVPRFHQEDLSPGQKLLAFFDLTTKYGPTQGLTRLQRWNRAHRLGKQPPQHIRTILEAAQQSKDYKEKYEMSIFGTLG